MSDTIRTALLFLIDTLFNLYLFILILRFILACGRANYFSPVTQFIVRLTDPIIKPLRKVIPNIKRIEIASLVVILAIEVMKFFLIACISYGFPNLLGLPILAIANTISLVIQIFTYGIILQAILSFVQPMSPLMSVLSQFNAPILQPFQRLVPPIGGLDLTAIPALISLQLMSIILVSPLLAVGQGIAFS
jgi:YggT family protein